MIDRRYSSLLEHNRQYFPALVLTGARQVGKTTLLQDLFSDYNYVSLDIPSVSRMAETRPKDFFEKYKLPLIIDEVQYAPELFRYLKVIIDADRHNMGRLILTGSQKFVLMENVSESLAGRCAIMELENLSCNEIQAHDGSRNEKEIMYRGQFPELWRIPDFPEKTFYKSYLSTYLERDVRQIINVPNLYDFEKFIRLLAVQSGQMLNKAELAKAVGVSASTIQNWISVLEASNQITLLQPWFSNFGKRIVKSPKVYFNDSGFLCYILNVESESLSTSPFLGAIWEAFVFAELRKLNALLDQPLNIWYYRDQRGREIDFFLEGKGRISLLECKWKEIAGKDDLKHINVIHKEINESSSPWQTGNHYVLCNTEAEYSISDSCLATNLQSVARLLAKH